MAKDFLSAIKKQSDSKEESILNIKLAEQNKEIENLKSLLENKSSGSEFNINDIKLVDNIRTNIDNIGLEELKNSIVENGQLQPVLITNDNYLIAGYRRYTALKKLNAKKIYAHVYKKKYSELKNEIKVLQFEENEKRKSLDNIDISILFNNCIKEGMTQQEISETFKKSKGFVSSVLRIKNLNKALIDYIRELQIYAFSYKKFIAMNFDNNIEENKFYQKNRGIIGWQTLYNIAKYDDLSEQKKAFLRAFKNRLSEDELNSKFFGKEFNELSKLKNTTDYQVAIKAFDSLKGFIDSMDNVSDKEMNELKQHLLSAEEILLKLCNSEK